MTQLTLKEIQSELLGIMKYIHNFCITNNIRYSLDGGTLIGAIRHNGFIPWDDDIDIVIPRPDYNRFIKTFAGNDKYKLFTPENNNSYINYARVCEVKDTIGDYMVPWTKDKSGVVIDIFPLDGEPDDRKEWEIEVKKLIQYRNLMFFSRLPHSVYRKDLGLLFNTKIFIKKILFWWINTEQINRKSIALASSYNYDTANYVGQMSFLNMWEKKHMPKEWYSDFILHKFEDTEFYITKGYHEVLTALYGDYMKLPPEEARVPGHNKLECFYWIER